MFFISSPQVYWFILTVNQNFTLWWLLSLKSTYCQRLMGFKFTVCLNAFTTIRCTRGSNAGLKRNVNLPVAFSPHAQLPWFKYDELGTITSAASNVALLVIQSCYIYYTWFVRKGCPSGRWDWHLPLHLWHLTSGKPIMQCDAQNAERKVQTMAV